jgi:hypothetical protein
VEEKLREDFPVRHPQFFSTGKGELLVDNRAPASMPAGTVGLVTFDGVFDRGIRSPARG